MLKNRLIPVLNIKNGLIVRSESFSYHQNIGNVINEAHRYNEWDVDELIYVDISRTNDYETRRDDHKIKSSESIEHIIKDISKVCYMPLTFGGGIRCIEDVDLRVRNGADKITINSGAVANPQLIKDISQKYGSQCVILSIDYKIIDNEPIVFSNFGTENTSINVIDWVREAQVLGAGEVFLNSIENDGRASGYDIETIGKVVDFSSLPVIACGGAADEFDILDVFKLTKTSAVAAGNMFHFTEMSYKRTKQLLKQNRINIR